MKRKNSNHIKMSTGERIFQVFNYAFLALLAFVCLYPMWHVLMASFSSSAELMAHQGLLFKPLNFTLECYKRVFENENILTGYVNTVKWLVLGISSSMFMTILGAYFFSRRDVLLRRPLMILVTFTMFFSGGMIPTYLNIKQLHLDNTIWGLIIPFCISTYNLIILRTSFESIPESLVEAAKLDGAGNVQILLRIMLPLTKATLAVLVLYYGVTIWNSWFWASHILQNRQDMPLAVFLREILIQNLTQAMDSGMPTAEGIKYALIVVATVPILMIYPFIQKYFTKGVMVGAVKE